MMMHPYGNTCSSGSSLAMEALKFNFTGKSSLAANTPENGINALMTGLSVKISLYEPSFDDMNTNKNLSKSFNENLRICGITDINPPENICSLDMENVSYIVPSIHPLLGIGNPKLNLHTKEMDKATITQQARNSLIIGATALACTGYDVITDNNLLFMIKKEIKTIAISFKHVYISMGIEYIPGINEYEATEFTLFFPILPL